jgi:hypothetical protein
VCPARPPGAWPLGGQTPGGRLVIDRAKLEAEARLDGKFLLSTSDADLSPEDIALGYKNLLEAERAFHDLKTTLELRPVFHRLEHRIRAHVQLCWLALLLVRVAERQTRSTWRRINIDLGRLQLVTVAGPAGRMEQTTTLTPAQRELFAASGIAPPPRVTSLQPRLNPGRIGPVGVGTRRPSARPLILPAQRPNSGDRMLTNCGTRASATPGLPGVTCHAWLGQWSRISWNTRSLCQ